jgi:acyl-CoA thioester hydrolase
LEKYDFELEMSVRDYECDIQGVVNNSVYQNYLEHTRHEYLKSIGINFKDYADKGINLTVTRAELDFKHPLTSCDKFIVTLKLKKESKVRFAFYQDILLLPEKKVVIKGKIVGVALNTKGRPYIPDEFTKILENENII